MLHYLKVVSVLLNFFIILKSDLSTFGTCLQVEYGRQGAVEPRVRKKGERRATKNLTERTTYQGGEIIFFFGDSSQVSGGRRVQQP